MATDGVRQMADRVAGLMAERLEIGGHGLAEKLRRGGDRLPSGVRSEAQVLAEAAALAGHPRLVARIDPARIERAYRTCHRHLRGIGRWRRRGDAALALAGRLAGAVLAAAAVGIGLCWWRGLL